MSETVSFIKKSKGRPAGLKKTSKSYDEEASQKEVVVLPGKRATPSQFSTGGLTKRARAQQEALDLEEAADRADLTGVAYSSHSRVLDRRSKSPSPSALGTRDVDGPLHPTLGRGKEGDVLEGDEAERADGLYKGASAYSSQLPKGSAKYGPVKGPANVRTITLTDYQPDVCKDYKETGFCGFGDTCKFLHDRGDYMHGWQLDNMFLSSQAQKNAQPVVEEAVEEELPFACLICRKPFTDPIVTQCGHYFCSACAIKRFLKTPKCYACNGPTGGIFNKAHKIIEVQKKAREAQEQGDQDDAGLTAQGEETGYEIEGLAEDVDRVVEPRPAQVPAEELEAEGEGEYKYFEED
ncbi:uncharacterized protein L969DRAFT_103470 [Mixia osmundae IAM 14324]|uniref:Pre-mRNA-splicing factor CWC24 n=1 Tax=Mixia osmundae (strain CBS 9802 / IAM 14324 / JCM 22182 / KY 12970) TaxID=764103 RepID=G7DVZ3_MIXOS|nr:uncharacterized protein L969DRAFT_103470 [Mixia osmundae IAM 14324]KEI39565.1 hypothetical protein L969DRAFT_103470 [Mixia osmundae IAM 14324]GAA94753.1 hypothetical protein E5Q_01407 [Mixia osmundae IAM 14324]